MTEEVQKADLERILKMFMEGMHLSELFKVRRKIDKSPES